MFDPDSTTKAHGPTPFSLKPPEENPFGFFYKPPF